MIERERESAIAQSTVRRIDIDVQPYKRQKRIE